MNRGREKIPLNCIYHKEKLEKESQYHRESVCVVLYVILVFYHFYPLFFCLSYNVCLQSSALASLQELDYL